MKKSFFILAFALASLLPFTTVGVAGNALATDSPLRVGWGG